MKRMTKPTARAFTGAALLLALAASPAMGYDILTSEYLFGDWAGRRTALEEQGYKFTFNYTADSLWNHGGPKEALSFFGRARFIADIDMEKAAGLAGGRLFISALSQDGDLPQNRAGTYSPLSSIAGADTTRLDQFFYEQSLFDDLVKVRLGQVAGVDEFGAQPYGGYFVNNQLGYATNLEFNSRIPFNAGAQPGVIIEVGREEGLYGKVGVFSGKPDPFNNDKHGIDFDIEDDSTVYAAEVGYRFGGDLPGDIRLGAHYNDGTFTRLDNGQQVDGNHVIYAMANKTVWQDPTDKKRGIDIGISAFFAPTSRNTTSSEILLSAAYRGIVPCRPDDFLSFGFVRNDFGKEASDASRAGGFGGLGEEYVMELSYKFQVTPAFAIQPDVQYIMNPAGTSRSDVWVAGFRTSINF